MKKNADKMGHNSVWKLKKIDDKFTILQYINRLIINDLKLINKFLWRIHLLSFNFLHIKRLFGSKFSLYINVK